jgi:tRNA A37 threonylcarbamoyladenosine synthetase subunit TsaC/SUA5/YrdC
MPDEDFTWQMLRRTGPLAATLANLTGEPSLLTTQEVIDQLRGRIDLVLD